MGYDLALLLLAPAILLLSMIAFPGRLMSRPIQAIATTLAALHFLVSSGVAIAFMAGWIPAIHETLLQYSGESWFALTIRYDGVSSLMLPLVSFVGWVTAVYSVRYLDGERTQGRYFRFLAFTIGAVSLMVLAGNFTVFIASWVMTSLGLHHLLLHYSERPQAKRAAWTKFTISRCGDAALIAAAIVTYSQFGTLDFAELYSAANEVVSATFAMQAAAFLLIIAGITKSAQFPVHTWLPQTMETPTPVSALMHAGIVNAGGYLIIRTSPLVSLGPWALTTLAIVGATTACFAAIVMLTQTSVKKSLAYSTVAQMGFMMLQCGLGAFSAAMLHILAHSLYKAHAFLSSGSVMQQRAATLGATENNSSGRWLTFLSTGAGVVLFFGAASYAMGVDLWNKPGGLLLGGILCLAIVHWIWSVVRTGNRSLLPPAIATSGGLLVAYLVGFSVVNSVISASLPNTGVPVHSGLVSAAIGLGFAGLFYFHAFLATQPQPQWMGRLHIHASNGFYLENLYRRVFGPLLTS